LKNWILKKIGVFQVFLVFFCCDVRFWVENGGGYVRIEGVGKKGKKKGVKNEHKLTEINTFCHKMNKNCNELT